jgi:GMP synthase-like glutamine amidotransferase
LPHADPAYFDLDVPILGICYGLQEIVYRSSADNVVAGITREYGYADLKAKRVNGHVDRLFEGLEDEFKVWMSHGDKLAKLPEGFHTIATTPNSEFAAIALLMKASTYMAFNYTLKSHTRKTASKFWRTLLSGFVAPSRIGLWLISSTKKFCGFANWSEMARF